MYTTLLECYVYLFDETPRSEKYQYMDSTNWFDYRFRILLFQSYARYFPIFEHVKIQKTIMRTSIEWWTLFSTEAKFCIWDGTTRNVSLLKIKCSHWKLFCSSFEKKKNQINIFLDELFTWIIRTVRIIARLIISPLEIVHN